MASILKILAASVGGGIVLGAGIRLGEAMASQLPVPGGEAGNKLAERLDNLEKRVGALAPQAAPEQVREELRGWIEETVAERLTEAEARLKTEAARGQKEMLDAFAAGVETRVIQRISRLEDEVASQSDAMQELRECSLRTETSVQKLLGGLDKLIVKSSPAAAENASPTDAAAERAAEPSAAGPSAATLPLRPMAAFTLPEKRRWKLFG